MTPKMAAERKALTRYGCWDGREPTQHRLSNDEILRAKKLAAQRSDLPMVGQLMGDPSPQRFGERADDGSAHMAYIAKCLSSHSRDE